MDLVAVRDELRDRAGVLKSKADALLEEADALSAEAEALEETALNRNRTLICGISLFRMYAA